MTVPQPLPMLRPFAEAVAFQRERVPMTRAQFDTLSDAAKRRAFTVAGITKKASIEEAYRLATAAIADGKTKSEFLEEFSKVLDEHGGVVLSPRRLDLISQNNTAAAYSAGRYAQLQDPDVTRLRPYLQYPLGPNDGRTSEICRRLQGFVARHDHPCWKRIAPANHHGERHLRLTSLTEEQARASGKLYEGADTDEFPFIDGARVLPDPGFSFEPGLLNADDRYLVEAARAAGVVLPAKTAADYGLAPLQSLAIEDLPVAPPRGPAIFDIGSAAEYDAAWQRFRAAMEMPEGEDETILGDAFGDGVRVNREAFNHITGAGGSEKDRADRAGRAVFFSFIRPTLEDPAEVWIVARGGDGGAPKFSKRYLAVFRQGQTRKAYVVAIEESPEGWLMKSSFRDSDWKHLEGQRAGRLLLSKVRKG